MDKRVVAILCSDVHFSLRPPVARSAEDNWWNAQDRQWLEILRLWNDFYHPPIIIAGDIFDRWNPPVELVNEVIGLFQWFMKKSGPSIYVIPGQHDLPNHSYQEAYRSAYSTLELAGVVHDLDCFNSVHFGDSTLGITPFWWGEEITPLEKADGNAINIAVCHSYIYQDGNGHPGVDESKSVGGYLKKLDGYDVAVFGDNHQGFLEGKILNCGTFYRRKIDEKNYQPQVGLLYDDKTIGIHKLDVSADKFIDEQEFPEMQNGVFAELMDDLLKSDQDLLDDFRAAVNRVMDKAVVSDSVRRMVLAALEA